MIALVLLLLLQPAPADRADADRLFELGTALVAEGDTAGAVAAWEGARATGWTAAAVEHNLGTVALGQGDAPRARLHLERAARLAPADEAVRQNLRLARERLGIPAASPVEVAWARASAVVPPAGWVALALALVFGAVGLALAGRRRGAGGLGVVAAAAVVIAGLAVWGATQAEGIVLLDQAVVAEAPSPTAPAVARLRAGEAVRLGEATEGWREVRVDGEAGWVPEAAVAPL